jgi:hypothetical protein
MPAVYRNEIRIEPVGFPEVMKALEQITPDVKMAVQNTIKKALPFAEKEVVEQILRRYHISRPSLLDQSSRHGRWKIKIKNPTTSNLNGGLQITGTRMPVMRFKVSPNTVPDQKGIPVGSRIPVTIRVVKWGSPQIRKPNVFLAKMKTGHIGVYRRKIPNPGGPRRIRDDGQRTQLPITEEYMLSVPEMMAGKKLRAKFDDNLNKYVQSVLIEELKKIPKKARRSMLRTLGKMFGEIGEMFSEMF